VAGQPDLGPAAQLGHGRLHQQLAAGGQTVLLSSHLLAEVQEICDRVGIIAGGKLLVQSTVAELRGATEIRLSGRPLDRALAVAMRVAGEDAVEVAGPAERRDDQGAELRIAAPADRVPELARALVAADVDIAGLHSVERSLEEVFFDLTGTTTHHLTPTAPTEVPA
jgi:ABC-type multidrug transport system ATPase subunit